jgi:hypothetical protein
MYILAEGMQLAVDDRLRPEHSFSAVGPRTQGAWRRAAMPRCSYKGVTTPAHSRPNTLCA